MWYCVITGAHFKSSSVVDLTLTLYCVLLIVFIVNWTRCVSVNSISCHDAGLRDPADFGNVEIIFQDREIGRVYAVAYDENGW